MRKQIKKKVRAQIKVELSQSLEQVKAILHKVLLSQNDSADGNLTRGNHSPSMSAADE